MSTEQTPASAPEEGIPGHDPQQTAPTTPLGGTAAEQITTEPAASGYPAPEPGALAPPAGAQQARPRTGPIVWGAIVLAICVYMATQTLAPGSIDSMTFVIASVIGLGVLLLAVGAAVLARNSRQR
jgi:hypothetical protein